MDVSIYFAKLESIFNTNFASDFVSGLGGTAILDLGLDDIRGMCDGSPFPITKAAKSNL